VDPRVGVGVVEKRKLLTLAVQLVVRRVTD
jgi:hypothetical protein